MRYLLPFAIVVIIAAVLILFAEKNRKEIELQTTPGSAENRREKADLDDSLTAMLKDELLNRGWTDSTDSISISSFDSVGKAYTIHRHRGKIIDHWIYIPEQYAVVDTTNNKEFMIGPIITKEDRKKLQQYNPISNH